MCEERERLIGYLYDECDANERRAVDAHLEHCSTCRQEVQALRGVRADLLAWEVPGAPQVWRPFTAPVQPAWWRQVPGWAMAAAAGLVLAAGLAGGMSARALSPGGAAAQDAANAAVPVVAGITAGDLAAAQQRILDLVRIELDQRTARPDPRQNVRYVSRGVNDQALQQVNALSMESEETFKAISLLYEENLDFRDKTDQRLKQLQDQVTLLNQVLLNSGFGVGGSGVQR